MTELSSRCGAGPRPSPAAVDCLQEFSLPYGGKCALFELVLRHAPIGMALLTSTGCFLAVNDALGCLFGLDEHALLGMGLAAVTHPDDREGSRQLLADVLAGRGQGFRREIRHLHADGRVIRGQVSVGCLRPQPESGGLLILQILELPADEAQGSLLAAAPILDPATARDRDRVVFGERCSEEALRELALQADLRAALEAGALQPWFMPVVDLASGGLCGYEALVRWCRPDSTVEQPDGFLPAARRARLAVAIDRLVLRRCVTTLASLPEELFVAANITPATLADDDLAGTVRRWLEQDGVSPSRLHLEITEPDLPGLSPPVRATIEQLAALGVRWLLDDFGTGCSSISVLRDLPIHAIKLDRSFMAGIGSGDQKSLRLAQSLAGLAEGLGLDTVAEGVETAVAAASLLDLGWRRAQGWHYGAAAPLPSRCPAPVLPRLLITSLSPIRWALAVTDTVPVGLFALQFTPEGAGRFLFASRRWLEMLLLEREAAFAARSPFQGETRIVVNWAVRWISAESVPRSLPDGSTVWEGVLSDITERIETSEQLRREKERLRLLAENATDVVVKLSATGRLEWASASIGTVLGWSPEQVIGRPFVSLLPGEEAPRLEALRPALAAGEEVRLEVRPLRRRGGSRWMSFALRPLRAADGRLHGLVGGLRDIDEEVRARQEMARERARLALTLDSLLDPHLTLEAAVQPGSRRVGFLCVDANAAACAYLALTVEQLVGASLEQLLPTPALVALLPRFHQVLERGIPLALNEIAFADDRLARHCFWDLRVVRVADRLSFSWRDVSERVAAARRLAASEEQYRLLAEHSSDVVLQVAEDGTIRWVSPSLTAMLGWQPSEWIGRPGTDFLEHRGTADHYLASLARLQDGQTVVTRDRILARRGSWHWVEIHACPFRDADGAIDGIVASFRTVDAEVVAEEEMSRLASTDPLTGLLNRREILGQLDACAARGRCGAGPGHTALLFCDLDRFKGINDHHGHAAGDQVLRAVAARIRACLRHDDLAARLGGDELLVVLRRVRDLETAVAIAEKIRRAGLEPVPTDAGPLRISLSIGVTLALPGEDSDALIARADAAMYEAKLGGRNRVIPFCSPPAAPVSPSPTPSRPSP